MGILLWFPLDIFYDWDFIEKEKKLCRNSSFVFNENKSHNFIRVSAMDYFPFEVLFTKPSLIFLFRFHVNVGRDLSSIINPRFLIHSMYLVTRNLEISRDIFFIVSFGLILWGSNTFK